MIKSNAHWQGLIKKRVFEEDQALLSCKISERGLASINPHKYADLLKPDNQAPTLATVRKYQSDIPTKAVVLKLVYELRDLVSFERRLNDKQSELLTEMILADYYHFTLADIRLAFRNGVKGIYGKIYQNLDIETVYGWLGQYLTERTEYLRTYEQQEKEQKEADTPINFEAINIIQQSLAKILSKNRKEQKTSFIYPTITAYCKAKGLNAEAYLTGLQEESEIEYEQTNKDISKEMYFTYKINLHRLELNEAEQNTTINKNSQD